MDLRKGSEEGLHSLQIWRAGWRSGAGHSAQEVANSSPFPWSEAQGTDFDQNKTALTRVHYSKTSVALLGGSLLGSQPTVGEMSVGGGQCPA